MQTPLKNVRKIALLVVSMGVITTSCYSDATHSITFKSMSMYPISLTLGKAICITKIAGAPVTILPNQSITVIVSDNDKNNCDYREKSQEFGFRSTNGRLFGMVKYYHNFKNNSIHFKGSYWRDGVDSKHYTQSHVALGARCGTDSKKCLNHSVKNGNGPVNITLIPSGPPLTISLTFTRPNNDNFNLTELSLWAGEIRNNLSIYKYIKDSNYQLSPDNKKLTYSVTIE